MPERNVKRRSRVPRQPRTGCRTNRLASGSRCGWLGAALLGLWVSGCALIAPVEDVRPTAPARQTNSGVTGATTQAPRTPIVPADSDAGDDELDPGAIVDPNTPPGSGTAKLVIDWAIQGKQEPDFCTLANVELINVELRRADGRALLPRTADCIAFRGTFMLPPGDYAGSVWLLDDKGQARTTAVPLDPFTLEDRQEVSRLIDFPSGSFYRR